MWPAGEELDPALTPLGFRTWIPDRSLRVAFNPPGGRLLFAARLVVSSLAYLVVLGLLLFVPAGTFAWPRAWWFLGVNIVAQLVTVLSFLPGHPGLLDQRLQSPIQRDQPFADRIFVVFFAFTFIALLIAIPLDVFRFHLAPVPGPLVTLVGLVAFLAGWLIAALAAKENPFATPVVKHERRQRVVSSGVYAVVRHPMYAGSIPLLLGIPLFLGSYAAVLLVVPLIAAIALRIVFEERFLRRELEGYDAYARTVRYRLIPFVW